MDNIMIANFTKYETVNVSGLWQYSYGQILRIRGLNLPTAVEIHFALQEKGGDSVTRVGMTKDGVTDVVIPDSMLENNDTNQDYNIYAFIYLADETSGQTEYKIKMFVQSRPRPEAFDRPEDAELFREAIQAVNGSAERAESAAEESEKNAQQTADDRETVKEMVTVVSDIKEQVQEVKEYKEQAQTAATNALLSENESAKAKEEAVKAQTGAESAEDAAEQHALEVAGDKAEVEQLAGQVRQDKTSVEQTVQSFGNTVQQAEQSIGNAGVQMVQKVTEEGTKQVKAVQDKGNEVLQSIPEDFPTQMSTKLDKSGHAPDKYLGTDSEGNVVEKEAPTGGDTGTTDYNGLENKPKINGTELSGEKSLEDLGIQPKGNYAKKDDIPTQLPNPNKLTFSGAVEVEYDGSDAVVITIPEGSTIERIEKLATDTVVELEANKLYIFPEMANLTYTLKTPTDDAASEYHFIFRSGAIPTQVVHPIGVNVGKFWVGANKIYEISIMENLLTSQSWEV